MAAGRRKLAVRSPQERPPEHSIQTAIPCLFMRGGTSRGPFFAAADLPADIALRDRVLLAVMGSPDKRQIDGLGGAHPLTSKVGIVSSRQQAGRGPRFPVRAAAAGQGHRRHHAQLRQHARGRGAVRARDRHGEAAGRHQHLPRADAQHRHAVRHHRANARRPRRVRGRRADRRRARNVGARSRSTSSTPPGRSARGCCRPAMSAT